VPRPTKRSTKRPTKRSTPDSTKRSTPDSTKRSTPDSSKRPSKRPVTRSTKRLETAGKTQRAHRPRKPTRAVLRGPTAADVSAEAAEILTPAPVLAGAERKRLRGLAHALEPLVHVGHAGVTEGVISAVRRALLDHELIKVRLHEPKDKHAMAEALADGTRSALCGLIGHTAILYRPRPQERDAKRAKSRRSGADERAPS